jgi:hypothetical protein
MIKSFSARPPYTLIIHYQNGRQRTLNLKEWIEADPVHQTLRQPAIFITVYKSASGGAEWAHGPHLDPGIIDSMLEQQRG